jgi:hypothetical protein
MMKTRADTEQSLCDSIVVEGKDLGSQMIEKAPYDDNADAEDGDDDDDDDNASMASTTAPRKLLNTINEVNEAERKEMLAIEQMASKETFRVDLGVSLQLLFSSSWPWPLRSQHSPFWTARISKTLTRR